MIEVKSVAPSAVHEFTEPIPFLAFDPIAEEIVKWIPPL